MNVTNASRESIAKYVRDLNFTSPVSRAVERHLRANVVPQPRKMKKIQDDIDAVVAHLKQKLGATWRAASQPRDQRNSLLLNPAMSGRPW
eukprot:1206886-Pleurochrysis_carterae.AAC.1